MPWEIYADQTLHANSLTNGVGTIDIDVLRRGQYAFAKGLGIAGIGSQEADESHLTVFPVPATDRLTVRVGPASKGIVRLDILGTDGRMVMRAVRSVDGNSEAALDISSLASGSYVLQARSLSGTDFGHSTFLVGR
jgi:hypothetical protein